MDGADFRFSDHFDLGDQSASEWFDPFLNLDTALYVDPFLIYGSERDEFAGAHDEIISFFKHIFEEIARSSGITTSAPYTRAVDCLTFKEAEEACLGLTAEGTDGAGSGIDLAKQIARAIWTAIEHGAQHLTHFEEVQIFGYGIGPDRISDATLRIILHRFANYTERVSRDLGLATELQVYPRSRFDLEKRIWIGGEYQLPMNPFNGKPVFLVPKRYLRPFPTLNHEDFWNYCREREGVALAEIFGSDIVGKMPKEEIVAIALTSPELRERYVANREREGGVPYDFETDPRGFIHWYEATKEWVRQNLPALGFSNSEEFCQFVGALVDMFGNYVENQGGWHLLWNDNKTPKREDSAQRLFVGIVTHACAANDVDISREANIGRGPVDFKVSSGFSKRALIEVKLARNTKFWSGLRGQLPTYLKAEGIETGWFLPIVYDDKDLAKISFIEDEINALNADLPFDLRYGIIDARRSPPSASNVDLFGER